VLLNISIQKLIAINLKRNAIKTNAMTKNYSAAASSPLSIYLTGYLTVLKHCQQFQQAVSIQLK